MILASTWRFVLRCQQRKCCPQALLRRRTQCYTTHQHEGCRLCCCSIEQQQTLASATWWHQQKNLRYTVTVTPTCCSGFGQMDTDVLALHRSVCHGRYSRRWHKRMTADNGRRVEDQDVRHVPPRPLPQSAAQIAAAAQACNERSGPVCSARAARPHRGAPQSVAWLREQQQHTGVPGFARVRHDTQSSGRHPGARRAGIQREGR